MYEKRVKGKELETGLPTRRNFAARGGGTSGEERVEGGRVGKGREGEKEE